MRLCMWFLTVAMVAAGPAAAQSSSRSAGRDLAFAEALLAETSTDELAERLGLSDAQRERLAPILLDLTILYYELNEQWQQWDREVMRLNDESRALENSDPPDHRAIIRLIPEINKAQEEMREGRKSARQALRSAHRDAVAAVDGGLSDPQKERFRAMQRDWRRRRTLTSEAYFAAERVDLVNLFLERDLLSAAEMETVRPALDRYAEDLDGLLRDRNELVWREEELKYQPHEPTQLDRAMKEGRISVEEYIPRYHDQVMQQRAEQIERVRPLMIRHTQIRDLTLANYQQGVSLIEPGSVNAVRVQFLSTAYFMEGIGRPRSPDRLIEESLALETFSSGQRARVESIRDSLWKPLRAEVELLIMQVRDRQQQEWEGRIRVEDEVWERLRQQFRAATDRRAALEKDTVRRVVEVLTDEQRGEVRLPVYE